MCFDKHRFNKYTLLLLLSVTPTFGIDFTQNPINEQNKNIKHELSLAVPQSISLEVNHTAYCLLEKSLDSMGYRIKKIKLPLIRSLTEAQNGHIAMAFIGKHNFETRSKSQTELQGIAMASTPYLISPISFYAHKNTNNIVMDTTKWTTNYRIGVTRSSYTHDIKKNTLKKSSNFYFYVNSLSTFKALLRQRVDVVIASRTEYLSAIGSLNITDEIKAFSTLGTVSVYLGFSYQYFGEDEAKKMARRYDKQRAKLTLNEVEQCDRPIN